MKKNFTSVSLKIFLTLLVIILSSSIGFSEGQSTYPYKTVNNDPLDARIYQLKNGLTVYMTIYKDAPRIQTYLAFKGKGKTLNNMGAEVEAETFFSDYKKVDGIMVAHTLVSYQEGEEFMTMTITDVKFNSGLEDSLFAMN